MSCHGEWMMDENMFQFGNPLQVFESCDRLNALASSRIGRKVS